MGIGVCFGMARANRHMTEAKPVQHLAHGALVKRNAKARGDHVAKIDAAPAHDTVVRKIGTLLHNLGKFSLLLLRQPGRWAWSLAVDKTIDA